jgi:hypothetical protein
MNAPVRPPAPTPLPVSAFDAARQAFLDAVIIMLGDPAITKTTKRIEIDSTLNALRHIALHSGLRIDA